MYAEQRALPLSSPRPAGERYSTANAAINMITRIDAGFTSVTDL
jgi:hypothetical protein